MTPLRQPLPLRIAIPGTGRDEVPAIVACCGPNGEDQPTGNVYYLFLAEVDPATGAGKIILRPKIRLVMIEGEHAPSGFVDGEIVNQVMQTGDTASGIVMAAQPENDLLIVQETSGTFEISEEEVTGNVGRVVPTGTRRDAKLATNFSEHLDNSHFIWPGQYVMTWRLPGPLDVWAFEA